MTDEIDEMFAAPMRRLVTSIGDSIHLHRLAADLDFEQAEMKLAQLVAVAVAAQQVMVALDNPPAPVSKRSGWGARRQEPGHNFNLTVTTDKLRTALSAFNNS